MTRERPTDDERRRIAERLRTQTGAVSLIHLWKAVTGETAPRLDRAARMELFDMLADLIEPEPEQTCFYVRDHQGSEGSWISKCTNCGAEFSERVVMEHFIYCPSCGAKVSECVRWTAKKK